MAPKLTLPDVPKEEQTPAVKVLISFCETLIVEVYSQQEKIAQLKDEINILKGEKKRPIFKPSKMEENTPNKDESSVPEGEPKKRPGSKKKAKTKHLPIHQTIVIQPECIPEGAIFKGYRDVVVQDIKINLCNTRYRLAYWVSKTEGNVTGKLPESLRKTHFGSTLQSYILYQYHEAMATQPIIHRQLTEWGVNISTGQINRLLSEGKMAFHDESDAILIAGLKSPYLGADDTVGRHQARNGYVTCLCNEYFSWYRSTNTKNRLNFLSLLSFPYQDYYLNEAALCYLASFFSKKYLEKLSQGFPVFFATEADWLAFLDKLNASDRHRQKLTEAALIGRLYAHNRCQDMVIITDDAGQFDVLLHALCWVHTERLIHKLIPLNEQHREEIAYIRGQIWDFYRALKAYQQKPTKKEKKRLKQEFDRIFEQKTSYQLLNQQLKRTKKNRSELLRVLDYPDIPLNTNFVENDIREWVKRRKISGGTRSDEGRLCRDTFMTLKKTCQKLGISFWDYLLDRVEGKQAILSLGEMVAEKILVGSDKITTGY